MNGVYVYIDGFNFYRGISHPGWLRYGWCNFVKLAACLSERAFGSSFPVEAVKYYTSPVRYGQENAPHERDRQEIWMEAIGAATPEVKVVQGRFQRIGNQPRREKETDVSIAVDMQWDAVHFGRAILISADSDFIPAIRKLRKAGKPVCVFFPPNQDGYKPPHEDSWRVERISREDLVECRLSDVIQRPGKQPILWSEYLRLRQQAGLSTT